MQAPDLRPGLRSSTLLVTSVCGDTGAAARREPARLQAEVAGVCRCVISSRRSDQQGPVAGTVADAWLSPLCQRRRALAETTVEGGLVEADGDRALPHHCPSR